VVAGTLLLLGYEPGAVEATRSQSCTDPNLNQRIAQFGRK
jgi:hypothetical protein